MLYNHAKLMAEDNRSSGKEYLVSIMFSHYDQNNNGALEREELEQVCIVINLQNYVVDTVKICCLVGRICHINVTGMRGNIVIAPLHFNLCSRGWQVVSFISGHSTSRERGPSMY